MKQTTGLLGRFGRVLREVAGELPGVVDRPKVTLLPPGDAPLAQLRRQVVSDRRRDGVDGAVDGVLEQPAGEPGVGRPNLITAVVGHRPVDPHGNVQMHQPARLVLGDLHVRDARELAQALLSDAQDRGQVTGQADRGAAPQLPKRVVPNHSAVMVEALHAQRLAETRIVLVMHLAAGEPHAVGADGRVASWAATARFAILAERSRMHHAEAGGGQGREHERVRGDAVGDALPAAQTAPLPRLTFGARGRRSMARTRLGAEVVAQPVGATRGRASMTAVSAVAA